MIGLEIESSRFVLGMRDERAHMEQYMPFHQDQSSKNFQIWKHRATLSLRSRVLAKGLLVSKKMHFLSYTT